MNKKAFSLIEILIAFAFLSMVLGASIYVFLNLNKVRISTRIHLLLKESGDYALAVLEKNIRNARRIMVSGDNKTLTITKPNGDVEEIVCYDSDGDSQDDYITYNAQALTISDPTLGVSLNGCQFVHILATAYQPSSLEITFSLVKGPFSELFHTKVSLRTY